MRHSTVTCFTFISQIFMCHNRVACWYFYWLNIHVVTVPWLVLLVNCSCLSQYNDWLHFIR